jgi:DNA repair exonuclease SbcCD ATPase subunit
LSKLISFGMAFEPLQMTIRDILRRLGQLERQNTSQDDHIAELSATVSNLEKANTALEERVAELESRAEKGEGGENVEGDATGPNADSDAIWDEIARLNSLLGELQEGAERDRHTIDEIYAARKRTQSVGAAAGEGEEGEQREAEDDHEKAGASKRPSASVGSGAVPPARKPSVARPLHSTEELAPTKPVGDVILEKAREELQFDGTHVYTAFEESAPTTSATADGEDHHVAASSDGNGGRGHALRSRAHSVSVSFASRPLSSGAGGEDAGEHRGSVAFATTPHSRPASRAQRRSVYADQRISAAAARRASQFLGGQSADAESRTSSVFDKLRRDGDDIAYLNRVVAEILGEMKDLHADVDQLRTNNEGDDPSAKRKSSEKDGSTSTSSPGGASLADLDEVRHRLARVEGDLGDTRQQLQHRHDDLQAELDELKKQLHAARSLTDDDLESLRNLRDLMGRLKQLEERVRALEVAQSALSDQFTSVLAVGENGEGDGGAAGINPLQFAALQGAVKNLEKQLADLLAAQGGQQDWSGQIRKLTETVRAIESDVEAAQDQLQRTVKETARLDELKANKSELPDPALMLSNKRRSSADSNMVAELLGRLTRAETSIERLNEDKADRSALQKLRDELNALKQLMEEVNAQLLELQSGNDSRTSAAMEKLLRELQVDVNNLKDALKHGSSYLTGGIGGEDMEDLRDRIERLDHCKADATLVANKAERDYVENALERLMREVEQVLNATNAGLIDTLEKSLNILRDMIDGKATKQDVANLQGWMAEANGGAGAGAAAADGLTGFKGFRCLGCNRPMDNMRPRTLPATMVPFLNRTPQNYPQDSVTRTIQQQQQRVVGPASSFTAGARPVAMTSSPDASLHRSTSSEPLPPIEPS